MNTVNVLNPIFVCVVWICLCVVWYKIGVMKGGSNAFRAATKVVDEIIKENEHFSINIQEKMETEDREEKINLLVDLGKASGKGEAAERLLTAIHERNK